MSKGVIKKIYNIFTTVVVGFTIVIALVLIGTKVTGIKNFVVVSPSMEPNYPVGSLIFVKPTVQEEIKVNDVITFAIDDNTVATHRVVAISEDGNYYTTKGDANEYEDATAVYYGNVVGKPILCMKKIGYVAAYLQQPQGKVLGIGIVGALLLLLFLPDIFFKEKKKEQ